jgi:hypothetical protein
MLLLFAAASLAQGDEKVAAALRDKGIPVSENFRLGTVERGSKTVRVALKEAGPLRDIGTGMLVTQAAVAGEWKDHSGEIRTPRAIELSKYLILCVAVDVRGEAVWLTTAADPRLIRAELSDENGNLTGREVDNPDPEILVTIPSNPAIREVRFFHPNWDGEKYDLVPIGMIKTTEARPGR